MGDTCKSITIAIAVIVGIAAIGPSQALANGGPVAWTQGTPVGGIGPRRVTDIRLVGEELRLRITDLDHYAVTARYKLDNPGPERTVTYGVPVAHVPLGRDRGSVTRKAALADSVHLHIGDQSFRCEVTDVARGPYLDDEARLSADESPKYFDAGDGWCVTNLAIPAGMHELVLEYTGELEFEDIEYSKSALRYFSHRTLRYQLWPAGYWRGPVDKFSVTVDLGPYAGHDVQHSLPEGAVDSGTRLRWEGAGIDLTRMRELRMELAGDDLLLTQELARWNRREHRYAQVSVHTSSNPAPEGEERHDNELMLDGDQATAWCASGPGDGVGEWIELRVRKQYGGCFLQEIAMLDSIRRNQALYLANNRIKTLRVAPCGNPRTYRDVTMSPPPGRVDESTIEIPLDRAHFPIDLKARPDVAEWRQYLELSAGPLRPFEVSGPRTAVPGKASSGGAGEICLRLTILNVFPGHGSHRTCVSELVPVVGCG
jgi:hypothetical protein